MSNDDNCILVGSLDNSLRLLDKESGELLNQYRGHSNTNYKIASCLDNTDAYVLSGSEDQKIYIWDLVDAKVLKELEGHSRAVSALAYHPSSPELLSGSFDGTVKVWR